MNQPLYTTELQSIDDRINISPNELLITESGLYLLRFGEALPLATVFADSDGLYIRVSSIRRKQLETCLNGHEVFCRNRKCLGCIEEWCVFRCRCFDRNR
jgi:hypothetical protein